MLDLYGQAQRLGAQRPALQSIIHFIRKYKIGFRDSRHAPWRSAEAPGWAAYLSFLCIDLSAVRRVELWFGIALSLINETIVHNFKHFIVPHLGFPLGIKESGIYAGGMIVVKRCFVSYITKSYIICAYVDIGLNNTPVSLRLRLKRVVHYCIRLAWFIPQRNFFGGNNGDFSS